jgi:hypothetical protein
MVNLGLMEPEAAQQFLMKEVVLSEPMAKQEVDRYSFKAPGQATSYFYGYQKQLAIRARTEIALGSRFDALSYHDFVISQGLLPPDLLDEAVAGYYIPSASRPPWLGHPRPNEMSRAPARCASAGHREPSQGTKHSTARIARRERVQRG